MSLKLSCIRWNVWRGENVFLVDFFAPTWSSDFIFANDFFLVRSLRSSWSVRPRSRRRRARRRRGRRSQGSTPSKKRRRPNLVNKDEGNFLNPSNIADALLFLTIQVPMSPRASTASARCSSPRRSPTGAWSTSGFWTPSSTTRRSGSGPDCTQAEPRVWKRSSKKSG